MCFVIWFTASRFVRSHPISIQTLSGNQCLASDFKDDELISSTTTRFVLSRAMVEWCSPEAMGDRVQPDLSDAHTSESGLSILSHQADRSQSNWKDHPCICVCEVASHNLAETQSSETSPKVEIVCGNKTDGPKGHNAMETSMDPSKHVHHGSMHSWRRHCPTMVVEILPFGIAMAMRRLAFKIAFDLSISQNILAFINWTIAKSPL